jgi:N12 class adenine-specific DNA methylase
MIPRTAMVAAREAIQYLPHRNCAQVAAWLGQPVDTCVKAVDSDVEWQLPDGRLVQAGDWLVRLPTGYVLVVPGEEVAA